MYNYYNEFFRISQQVLDINLYNLSLPKDDPVHVLIKVMEKMDFTALMNRYHRRGRKPYNPIMMFSIIIYASLRGIRSIDRIVDLCQRDICFMYLSRYKMPQRDTFYSFINDRLTEEILEDLHYQFIRLLEKENLVSLKSLYVDGTKIEANANRYTFVWRGSINSRLVKLLDTISRFYAKYNALITNKGYDVKYSLGLEKMFIIEGQDKLYDLIEKNKNRTLNNKKKLSNNIVLEIDNASPLELYSLQTKLGQIAEKEGFIFVSGKGQRKSELQKMYEEVESLGARLMKYKEAFRVMGPDRNSYSKTDVGATFMRMKDDHMKNGQLKPGYNVQIAVENYFIIHSYVSEDRTDYKTLIPVLEQHHQRFNYYPQNLTADSGYCSEKNLLFLKEHNIESYIKLQTHEKMKTRAYKNDIGRYENMTYDGEAYTCYNHRRIKFVGTSRRTRKGFKQTFKIFESESCEGCEVKEKCLYKYSPQKDKDRQKTLRINERWDKLKRWSHKNIMSESGILNRQIRSIQTEGFFGDMKANDGFRRFNHRSKEKVTKEMMLYIFGKNVDRYYRFITNQLKKFEGKVA